MGWAPAPPPNPATSQVAAALDALLAQRLQLVDVQPPRRPPPSRQPGQEQPQAAAARGQQAAAGEEAEPSAGDGTKTEKKNKKKKERKAKARTAEAEQDAGAASCSGRGHEQEETGGEQGGCDGDGGGFRFFRRVPRGTAVVLERPDGETWRQLLMQQLGWLCVAHGLVARHRGRL